MNKEFILDYNCRGIRVHHGGGNMSAGAENGEIIPSNEEMEQREQSGCGMRL